MDLQGGKPPPESRGPLWLLRFVTWTRMCLESDVLTLISFDSFSLKMRETWGSLLYQHIFLLTYPLTHSRFCFTFQITKRRFSWFYVVRVFIRNSRITYDPWQTLRPLTDHPTYSEVTHTLLLRPNFQFPPPMFYWFWTRYRKSSKLTHPLYPMHM